MQKANDVSQPLQPQTPQPHSQSAPKSKENLQHLRDPNTAPARIYIGNVSEHTTKADLELKFSKYGQINGILMQKGFAFLQFMAADSAQEAIANENKTMLNDKIIAVRTAVKDGNKNQQNHQQQNQTNVQVSQSQPQGLQTPLPFKSNTPFFRPAEANDLEIIVVSRELTPYAEAIEARLNQVGMSCDLLYPNSEVPMGKVLANISSRGTLYAVVVAPQNMEHSSITLNILYGTPAEHRNMPVEAALNLIEQDFLRYRANEGKTAPVMPSAMPITPVVSAPMDIKMPLERPFDAIHALLRLLAEDKPLTVLQYDRILKYLSEKREIQLKVELGDDPEAMAKLSKPMATLAEPEPKVDPAEAAMQKKINDIINKPSLITVYDSKREPFKMTPELLELLGDPRVERALDSLLSKEIFETLNLKF